MNEIVNENVLDNIAERLSKIEILVPDSEYAALFQSMRDDIRTLYGMVLLLQTRDQARQADDSLERVRADRQALNESLRNIIDSMSACITPDVA